MARCKYCGGECSDGTECGMNQIANSAISTPEYDSLSKQNEEGENTE